MKKLIFITLITLVSNISAQVRLETEIKISDLGLFFDGSQVGQNAPNGPKYDFVFGNRITPHGDCIKEYNGFVFLTWYKGGENDRHVMLSRYNKATGITKTIEFPHQHNGFQNKPHLGESHNTIAVGICPIDGTIHMLYDMHSYDENRPSNGSLANDYFRYSYSKKNAATVPDDQFNINQFVNSPSNNYKHLKMRNGTNYKSLTYPNFFLNTRGELFMWIREGGNTNGAYKFCKYDGNNWSDFTQFNVLDAKQSPGINHNWGLYGDIKFESGKMRIGFARRSSNNNDAYKLNNGFYYAYSDDPNGLTQWKDYNGNGFTLPLYNSERIKISEPTDVLGLSAPNSIYMNSGCDWTVTERGDIHSVTTVGTGSNRKNVHTYKKANTSNFLTSTNFPGGNLYTYNNEVYLIGLNNGKVFVEKAVGGTNNWTNIYTAPSSSKNFRHGNVYINNGKLHFYLMESKTGSAQPIYLQIYDLGINSPVNTPPSISLTNPSANNQEYTLGETITLTASATDDGPISRVNFKINGSYYQGDTSAPYSANWTPTIAGTYTIAARAFEEGQDGLSTEVTRTVRVNATTNPCTGVGNPTVNITSPTNNATFNQGQNVTINANATSTVNITKVEFYDGTTLVGTDTSRPYSFSTSSLSVGTHIFTAKAYNDCNKSALSGARTIDIKSVITPPPSSGPIAGPACGNALQALTFELSPSQRVNATSYSWWFRGAKESLTTAPNGYIATVVPTRGNGEICVGVRYSTGTSYVEYCKTITNCAVRTIQENNITIYPNPSKDGQFNIELKTNADVAITVTDVLGHQIFDSKFKNENEIFQKDLDLSKVEKGIYFLNLFYEGKVETSRLIIE